MKKIVFSGILFIIISICNAQEQVTKSVAEPQAAAAASGVATYWYMDEDGDGFGERGLEWTPIKSTNQPVGYVANNTDLDDTNYYITNIQPNYFYLDFDHDTFGNPNDVVYVSVKPANRVGNNLDCNDNDVTLNPNTVWYRDGDGDSYGTSATTTTSCTQPTGYVRNASDYNDSTGNITNIAPQMFYQDFDGDTFGNATVSLYYSVQPTGYVTNNLDCNDVDVTLNPNTVWYRDVDGDGYGKSTVTTVSCNQMTGYVRNSLDYDDSTGNITNIAPQTFYKDFDTDTFGNPAISLYYSVKPTGYVTNNLDCNDADVTLNPNTVWYRDGDGDSYGKSTVTTTSCTQPTGYVRNSLDFDDSTGNITNIAPQTFYKDFDTDTFGNPALSLYYSVKPAGYVTNNLDCNDADVTLNPNTVWYRDGDGDTYGKSTVTTTSCTQPIGYVRNSLDYDDSTGNITYIAPQTFYKDFDTDTFGNPAISLYYSVKPIGYVTNNLDCNDAEVTINPNTVWYSDGDGDGYGKSTVTTASCTQPAGYVRNSSDFDDSTGNITNIAPQTFYQDYDTDTFGNPGVSLYYSAKPIGYVTNNLDCNDADQTLNPNTKWYADNDLDGLGDPSVFMQQCTAPAGNYVRNNTDNCPLIKGTSSNCSNITNPSINQNYIITKTYKKATPTSLVTPDIEEVQTDITYFDGLGRPIQQIANRQSASSKDIITHIGYDEFGRQDKEYLPYAASSTNMAFEVNAEANTNAFYNTVQYENTANPFSQKKLENSPLQRVLKQAVPGNPWVMDAGHEIKLDYKTNTSATEVKLYKATATWNAGSGLYETTFSDAGNYGINQLYKTVTYDENSTANPTDETQGSTVEFRNKLGQVVLQRTYDAGAKHDTYYVYDNYGNLTYVIPPKVEGVIDVDVRNGLCYQYKYNDRNRLVEKKLPGKQWEFIVYDKLNRPVATGPASSPFKDDASIGWIITKYDAFSRPIYTGWNSQTATSAARKTLQDSQNLATVLYETKQASGTIDGIAAYYTNAIAPMSFKLLTVYYYDGYSFPGAQTVPSAIEGQVVLTNVKGLATGSWTRAVTTAAAISGESSTVFYDGEARPIQTYSLNYLTGYTSSTSNLDFAGKTIYTLTKHKRTSGSTELAIREDFAYTAQDRLLTHTHQIGANTQLMAANKYDELGQLTSKKVGNSTGSPLQKVDFNYNIRGWLTEINKTANLQQDSDPLDLFAFKLNYNQTPANANVKALYNGNIVESFWKTPSDYSLRSYGYKYDNLSRLTDAFYRKPDNAIPDTGAYNESLSYDKNGNIKFLQRYGTSDAPSIKFQIDDLTYGYLNDNSNRLTKVTDGAAGNNNEGFIDLNKTGDDYTYDDNGNIITDKNKNITALTYNQLNLVKKITFGTTGNIEYFYNATGQKVQKIVSETGKAAIVTDYLVGFQYKDNVLEFFPTAEGYVKNTAGVLTYVFQYKDHAGNVRVSYAKNPATQVLEIIEENNYYPFGLKHKGYNDYVPNINKNKYNGKEFQDELGLNMTAMDYRQYDNALGRFNSIDALAETSHSISPYAFSYNNPVYWSDPTGLLSQAFVSSLIRNSDDNSSTQWVNDGGGSFSKVGGMIDQESGEFTGIDHLREVTVFGRKTSGGGSHLEGNLGGLAQSKAYSYGIFYDGWRSNFRTKQMDGIQAWFDALGTADPSGIVDGINALGYLARGQKANAAIAAIAIIPYVGDAAKGLKYTKSTMKIGQEMHAAYKIAEHAPALRKFKEFREIKGIRPDFVDFTTNTIFELKPFNPRAMKAGEKQLAKYKAALELEYPGTIWNTVLDTY